MPTIQELDVTVARLCHISEDQFVDPYEALSWPTALHKEQWCFTPELISLYGMAEYEQLSEEKRQLLSFYEAVNFFSLNIHGEKSLIEGLARNLYVRADPNISPYLHHFLDEENKHMIYFGKFCSSYAGKIYPDKKLTLPRDFAEGEEEFLFFAKIMIFEEIVDVYNKWMAADERLARIARDINRLHHIDESRHLAFGRSMTQWLFQHFSPRWSPATLAGVRDHLKNYLKAVWHEYYNPSVYQDAGLQDVYDLQQRAFSRPEAHAHRQRVSRQCIQYFLNTQILIEEPVL